VTKVRELNPKCGPFWDGCCPCSSLSCKLGRQIKGTYWQDYITLLPGKILKTKRPYGIWQRGTVDGKKCVYLRCPCCGGINMVPAKEVNPKGYVRVERIVDEYGRGNDADIHCVTCLKCRTHFWPFLKGWRASIKRRKR